LSLGKYTVYSKIACGEKTEIFRGALLLCEVVMIDNFNLLATTMRGNERDMCNELYYLLKDELGDVQAQTAKTKIRGLIVGKTSLDPLFVMEKFRKIIAERPYEFRYALRIVPMQQVVLTDLVEIKKVTQELALKIGITETFRVTVEKRFSNLHSKEIIEATAGEIERKVDLKKPDWILQIEVLGRLTGISLLKPEDVLSVVKEKML
jgi:tRNA acetyltransferase TAN1